ncbi:MAG: hypothetical protein NFCOHLIN_02464 [Gammaproteobacteria bacterium]|nr:hypothetical protein [Gammaproteobacteria bacterium]
MKRLPMFTGTLLGTLAATPVLAGDTLDLDDVARWKLVSVETCLDQAIDTIPGEPRKLELKIEGDDPTYEFDIEAKDGYTYNVECNAEEGLITEIEREVKADDPLFKSLAKVSQEEARKFALAVHPGKVVAEEFEIGQDGAATYEFDIQTVMGPEIKIDVDAETGKIEEANVEVYEIGNEPE